MTPPPPIACTLSPDELRARGDHLLPFLTFTITAEADLGPVTVTVTAPPEAQALLADLIASAM